MTTKYLLQLLFKSFAFSFALAFILGSIYYIVTVNTTAYRYAIEPIVFGTLYLVMILTLMTFSVLFLTNTAIYQFRMLRMLVFFGGSLVFLAFVLIKEMSEADKSFYGITGISFFLVQCILYFRMISAYPPAKLS